MSPGIYRLTGEFDQSFKEEFISQILLQKKKKKDFSTDFLRSV